MSGLPELLREGAVAPGFRLEASDGRARTLGELLAAGRVLLVFYPGNDTPG